MLNNNDKQKLRHLYHWVEIILFASLFLANMFLFGFIFHTMVESLPDTNVVKMLGILAFIVVFDVMVIVKTYFDICNKKIK